MPLIIQVDGIIGAGKSYYIENVLIPALREMGFKVMLIPEPVEEWKEILPLFYQDMKRWAYTFQTKAMMDRVEQVRRCLQNHQEIDIFVSERGVTSDRMFMNILHDGGYVTDLEMEMYGKWWNMWYSLIMVAPTIVIYLNTEISLCQSRIVQRGREGEVTNDGQSIIAADYQTKLKAQHDLKYAGKSEVELVTWIPTKVIEINNTSEEITSWKTKTMELLASILKRP